MTHFLKDQMKYKSDPSFYQLFVETSQIWGKKFRKTFLPNERSLLFIPKWRNKIFQKLQIFYETLSLMKKMKKCTFLNISCK